MSAAYLIDELFKAQVRFAVELRPMPAGYRFSKATLHTLMPELVRCFAPDVANKVWPDLYGDENGPPSIVEGTVWGIPFIVDDSVPYGEVRFAKDGETWRRWLEGRVEVFL